MNKQHFSALAATAALFCAGTAHGLELVENGGFETGDFTGYEQFVLGGTQMVTTFNPSTGTFSANLNATANFGNDTLIKAANMGAGTLVPGQEFTVTFDARGTTANGGVAFAEFFSELDGGGTSAAEILGGAPLALNADPLVWTTFSYTTIAGSDVSGGVTLQLKAACGAVDGCMSDIYFDNISVTTVPVPAALWLFGSALGMLGWTRRRAA